MSNPAITVFMPVFNGSAYLSEAIDSVLAQTFKDFELLIINDGSTDNSATIIQSYHDPRIRLLHNEENKGLVYTRNRGVKEAKGKYLAILDCDDVAVPERLHLQYHFMQKFPEIAMCGGRAIFINRKGQVQGLSKSYPGNKKMQLVFENIFINSSAMMRADVIKAVNGYRDYAPAEDYDLAVRIAHTYPVVILEDILVKYRVHGNNISVTALDKMRLAEKRIIKDIQQRLGIEEDKLAEIHHSYFTGNENHFNLLEYFSLFKTLKLKNNQFGEYESAEFNKLLFDKWYELIRQHAGKEALPLFFKKPLFSFSFITFKQLRKMFKQSLKYLLKPSREKK